MSDAPHARLDIQDRVGVITLDRPEVLNAFSSQMGRELEAALRRCDEDEQVRVVVITGAGRAFCSGADLSNGPAVFGAPGDASSFSSDPLRYHPWDVRKPVIAAINGHAVGLGMTLALQCDLRIIARDAKCGIVQNRRGVMPDLHSHWTLPRIVGHARAAEILLTGKMFTGEDAAAWGLANEVHDAPQVLPRALEIARDIAVNVAPVSVGVSKRLLWRDPPPSRDEILRLETELHLHLMGAPDAREGVMAFLERRDPEWTMTLRDDWPQWLDDERIPPT
ncbi:MAG TPA: enoyl-CoA hydratase-related protein [Acidimicrobiales bacterium]